MFDELYDSVDVPVGVAEKFKQLNRHRWGRRKIFDSVELAIQQIHKQSRVFPLGSAFDAGGQLRVHRENMFSHPVARHFVQPPKQYGTPVSNSFFHANIKYPNAVVRFNDERRPPNRG